MARSLESNTVTAAPPLASITGGSAEGKGRVRRGRDVAKGPRSIKIGFFGEQGTGKTRSVLKMLLGGQKVLLLSADFGTTDEDPTIFNYFDDHPEQAELLDNLRIFSFDVKRLFSFLKDPTSIEGLEDIYEWDPDWLVFDGLSNFQMGILEDYLLGGDLLRKDTDYSLWKQTRNGTVFTLNKFLQLSNVRTGKPWSKVVTMLEAEKAKKHKVQDRGRVVLEDIEGTEKTGPLLDTTARQLASAGFDIVLQTVRRLPIGGGKPKFLYVASGDKLLTKDRSFLPEGQSEIQADEFWDNIIAKKLGWNK